jgi:hypothetical protein
MEGVSTQNLSRERSRGTSHTRALSRSSTSTTATRMTSQSNSSSNSRPAVSPQLATVHPAHRFHHSTCSRPASNQRTPSMLTRESSTESRQTTASSYLQEKLQRERKAEVEKASLTRTNTDMSGSADSRAFHSSPVRSTTSDGRRPRSSGGDAVKKKRMGVKETEEVCQRKLGSFLSVTVELH